MRAAAACLVVALTAGCAIDHDGAPEPEVALAAAIPPFGRPDTFDVATWNIEWFGSTHEGPSDEARQLAGARALVASLEVDLWAVEEVVSQEHFDDLLAGLPYDGLLASDPSVEGGSAFYGAGEQKVGIIFRPDQLEVVSARTILREHSWDFAGRPPLEVAMRDAAGGELFHVIVLHAKAARGFSDWERRRDGAAALAGYLAGERAGDDVLVIGDYNDDLDESTRGPSTPSPYADLAASWFFATWEIAAADQPTTLFSDQPIDHALAAGALADAYVDGSAVVFPADDHIDDYGWTTSDHLPVLMRFARGSRPPILINEALANEPGIDTDGEFVELVNAGAAEVALAGFSLSDSLAVRHVFPAGTSLAPGAALVVQTGELALSNGGDTVTLADPAGGVVDRVVYGPDLADADGVSMTRAIEGDRESAMVRHDEVSSLAASPGLRRDGSPF